MLDSNKKEILQQMWMDGSSLNAAVGIEANIDTSDTVSSDIEVTSEYRKENSFKIVSRIANDSTRR